MVHVDIFIPNQVSNGRKCLEITRIHYSVGESPQSLGLVSLAKEKPYQSLPILWMIQHPFARVVTATLEFSSHSFGNWLF